jgi:Short C-terminal domain
MINAAIPQTPAATANLPLEPAAALAVAQEVLVTPTPLATTFNMSKVHAEITGQGPEGFSYRTYLKSALMRMRMNDGYVVVTPAGPQGTRIQIHENKRYAMLWGGWMAALIVFCLIIYFAFLRDTTPQNPLAQYYYNHQPRSGFDWKVGALIGLVIGTIAGIAQLVEIIGLPGKMSRLIGQRAMAYAQGGQQGFAALPMAQPAFPGQPQPGFGQAAPHPGGFAGQPQGGIAPPPQPAFAPPPQPGFGQPPQGGFAPPQPGLAPAPQPGFTPPPQPPAPPPAEPHQLGIGEDPALAGKLAELASLRDSGIITDADFEQAKAALTGNRG